MKNAKMIILLSGLVFAACHYGTGTGEKKETPSEYINDTKLHPAKYADDEKAILKYLYGRLQLHKPPFESDEYYDSTVLKIDTILYNESYDKVSVFVLTKNPVSRQLMPNKAHAWYYDAYCFLGVREHDTINLKLLRPYSLSNFYNENETSGEIRNQYFKTFATLKDTSGAYVNKYNLDDRRFWESGVWKKYFGL